MAKRLLCILSSLDTGGAETFMMKIYRRFDKTQYQIDFIVSAEGFYDKEVLTLGGKIYQIPLRTQHPLKVFREIKKIVETNKYESVLKLGNNPMCVIDLIAVKIGGAKICAMRSCNALTSLSFRQKIINAIFRPLLNRTANIKIAPSDLAAKYTFGKKRAENGDVKYLHNAVDLSVFRYVEDDRSKIRQEFGLEDKLVIGHIGRLNHQKNHKFLLDVFAKIKEKEDKAVLVLVGKGELENEIKAKVDDLGLSNSVIFTGVRSDIPALLSAMDVFVFPSFYEGMPNTVIEAQATGLPCIIADTITREADITGLVRYMSLEESADTWADAALCVVSEERTDTKQKFIDNKYDIDSTVEYFTELVFGIEE